jgi:BlaI family transcriptional regulator, penicillinase repressor
MSVKLGKVQLQIMRILWDQGSATAREITSELNKSENIAHSTVQTLLRKLLDKNAVTHEQIDRTFLFKPAVSETEVTQAASLEFVNRIFKGSVSDLVAHLIENEQISQEELQRLRQLINEKGE